MGLENGSNEQFSFPQSPTCLGTIKAKASCDIFLKFTPLSGEVNKLASAKLFIESNDPRTIETNKRYTVETFATNVPSPVDGNNQGGNEEPENISGTTTTDICQGECVVKGDGSVSDTDTVGRQIESEKNPATTAASNFFAKLFDFLSKILDKIMSWLHL